MESYSTKFFQSIHDKGFKALDELERLFQNHSPVFEEGVKGLLNEKEYKLLTDLREINNRLWEYRHNTEEWREP